MSTAEKDYPRALGEGESVPANPGTVVSVRGSVVDIRFDAQLPGKKTTEGLDGLRRKPGRAKRRMSRRRSKRFFIVPGATARRLIRRLK